MKNIVLVHGGFVTALAGRGVYKILKRDGYSVSIVQNPTISLEDDVAVTSEFCNAGWTCNSRWPFLRGSGNH